ncbi:GntR family transcriptional regulator [Paenibacillus hodogayensis]|uniref:GntR family transcriptional regulator n=1 Tax=Paenibacillus hodogayensis TaxID=279208 RepID=A0ABV5VUB4_9BACL
MSKFLVVPGKSLSEQAYEAIRDSIITLRLEPGQTIYENELAESLQISRTPVRDAFHLLLSEGLVDVLPQRNKRVAFISELKVRESSFVRFSLESSAFRLAARHWEAAVDRAKTERQIEALLHEQDEAAEQQDVVRFLQLDEEFHRRILQLAGNETLLAVVNHLRGHLNRFRYLAMKELVLTKTLVHEHEELFDRLKRGDEDGAVGLLERHLGKLDSEFPRLRERFGSYFRD